MKRKQCPQCQRPLTVCYCHLIRPLSNQWPVRILQEHGESRHPMGTARIAALSLERCRLQEMMLSGPEATSQAGLDELINEEPVLIYPGDEAEPVDALAGQPVRPLLFLDANWRKSRRLLHQFPALSALPRYALRSTGASRYRIRSSAVTDALSTLEAVVSTLEVVERAAGRYSGLLDVMDWMVDQQIAFMGEEVYRAHYHK